MPSCTRTMIAHFVCSLDTNNDPNPSRTMSKMWHSGHSANVDCAVWQKSDSVLQYFGASNSEICCKHQWMVFVDQWTIVWCRWYVCNIRWAPKNVQAVHNDGIPIRWVRCLCLAQVPKILWHFCNEKRIQNRSKQRTLIETLELRKFASLWNVKYTTNIHRTSPMISTSFFRDPYASQLVVWKFTQNKYW